MPQTTEQIRVISHRSQPWAWFDKRVISRYGRQLGPHGLAVYMALAMHADGETQSCFPSIQTVSRETGVSRAQLKRVLHRMVTLKLIRKDAMWSPEGDPGPNTYVLLDVPDGPLDLSTGE
jgi:GntR family transcriptional regulator